MAIPVQSFEDLKVVTMTIVTTLNVEMMNLSAIFALLPVTKRSFAKDQRLQRKQGKVKFTPDMNTPGEILSMRHDGHVRGIIRSENPRFFPHTIILDMGAPQRIISVKLSKSIELTGPTSFEIAKITTDYLMDHIRTAQKRLELIQQNSKEALETAVAIWNSVSQLTPEIVFDADAYDITNASEVKNTILTLAHGYPIGQLHGFLSFLVTLATPLFIGPLVCENYESQMINVCYELGFNVNRVRMNDIMDSTPFTATYNNASSTREVVVLFSYTKVDRSSGKPKVAKQTIRIKPSGYVTHSGPNFESIRHVYYLFMKRVLLNIDTIQSSIQNEVRKIKINRNTRELSMNDYLSIIEKENQLKDDIINDRLITLMEDLTVTTSNETEVAEVEPTVSSETVVTPVTYHTFSYSPLLSTI